MSWLTVDKSNVEHSYGDQTMHWLSVDNSNVDHSYDEKLWVGSIIYIPVQE